MSPELTLFRKNGACSASPHALLLHLDIPFKSVVMRTGPDKRHYEAADGSFTHAEYKSINPSGYVPCLVVKPDHDAGEQVTITEVPAVMTYIASLKPEQNLLGDNPLERAKILEWMVWMSDQLLTSGYAAHWRPYRFAEDEAAHGAISAKGRKTIDASHRLIEARLKGKEWAVGDRLTAVEFCLYPFWNWTEDLDNMQMATDYPEYDKLMRKVEKLDAVRRMLSAENQKPLYP